MEWLWKYQKKKERQKEGDYIEKEGRGYNARGNRCGYKQNRREENNYDDDVDQKFVIYRKKIMYRRSRTMLIFLKNRTYFWLSILILREALRYSVI